MGGCWRPVQSLLHCATMTEKGVMRRPRSTGSHSHFFHIVVCLGLMSSALACGDDRPEPDIDLLRVERGLGEPCPEDVDGLLATAGVGAGERLDCGFVNGFDLPLVTDGIGCLFDAIETDQSAAFSVFYCIDCGVRTTYVNAPNSGLFEMAMRVNPASGQLSEADVGSCETVARTSDGEEIRCVDREPVFSCEGVRSPL